MMTMPTKPKGREWEDDFFNIAFPDSPKEILRSMLPGFQDIGIFPVFAGVEFEGRSDSIANAFKNAEYLNTRNGLPWNRRNPPEPFANRILQIFKGSDSIFTKKLRRQFVLIPTIGTPADLHHGIDGIVCLSNGKPLVTFDLSLDQSQKDSVGSKADVVITPAHLDNTSLFNDLRDEMLQIALRRLVQ